MKVINFFAGPGVGKSTTAAGTFYEMKKRQIKVELINEYAKFLTWERRFNVLADQLYILAKQNRGLVRLKDHGLQYAITDSPLPTSLLYTPDDYYPSYKPLLMEIFNSYDNFNILLTRSFSYDGVGRNQTEEQAQQIDKKCKELLDSCRIDYIEMSVGDNVPLKVIEMLENN